LSVGLGLFIGCLPLYGFHLPLCLLVCLPFGLDAVLAYVAANISNPFVAPFLIVAEVQIGSLLLHGRATGFDLAAAKHPNFAVIASEIAVGSLVLGGALGVLGGTVAAAIARRRAGTEPSAIEQARKRTVARYATARPGDRYYVAAKLRTDPALLDVAQLGALGDVLDAGCGRGQLSLCLAELGHVDRLSGFDFDARKVEVARAAAGERASFTVGDLTSSELDESDTILFMDVLHYLPLDEQDRLLARAARKLRPNGRIVVREVDAASKRKSFLTRAFELVGTRFGYNRAASALGFRPLADIERVLESAGLRSESIVRAAGSLLENGLVVARAPAP
jgi:2-polyprenyl-3-methyl-5-hydroxy-6-metoxy-1,4-benzoquinol methylase